MKRIIAIIAAIDILLIFFFAPSIFVNFFTNIFGDDIIGVAVMGIIALMVIVFLIARAVGGQ